MSPSSRPPAGRGRPAPRPAADDVLHVVGSDRPPRRMDPQGRQAIFSAPPTAAPDQLRPGHRQDGRHALYSTGPRQPGTALIICSSCGTRTRVSLGDLAVRLLSGSVWIPGRRHSRWLRCPGCHRYRWCQVAWNR